MSIEDASVILWRQEPVTSVDFSRFKRSVLQELSNRHILELGRSGKTGKSIKCDYIQALVKFVSHMNSLTLFMLMLF